MAHNKQSDYKRKNRVLYVVPALKNGGLERQLALTSECISEHWEVRVWSMDGGEYFNRLLQSGIQVDLCLRKNRFDISPAFHLWKLILDWKPEIVHSWGMLSSFAAFIPCMLHRIPFVNGIIRSSSLPPNRRWAIFFSKMLFKVSSVVLSNTKAGLKSWDVNEKKGKVIYNAFDNQRLLNETVREIDPSHFHAVMVARMTEEKDFQTLIKTARILTNSDDTWRFHLVGDGPTRDKLMKEASDLIEKGVVYFDRTSLDVINKIRQANVGVLMSNREEGCSNSIMEYMACGLPVICSEGGGNRELVIDKVTGFIIPVNDDKALMNALIYLKTHSEAREKLGRAGKNRIQSTFSIEKMVKELRNLYEELL